MKLNITPARPKVMPAISFPPLAVPLVADADGAVPVPEAATVAAGIVPVAVMTPL